MNDDYWKIKESSGTDRKEWKIFRQQNGNGLVKWTTFMGVSGNQQEGELDLTTKLLEVRVRQFCNFQYQVYILTGESEDMK